MRDPRPVVTPGCDPAVGNPATTRVGPLPSDGRTRVVALSDPPSWLRGIVLAPPGVIFENEHGDRLRLLDDGTLDPILAGGHARPGAAHATTTRPPAKGA